MKVEHSFKHLDHSDALQQYAEKRCHKLFKFETSPTHCHWVFSVQRHECYSEVLVRGKNMTFRASAASDDHYKSVDLVIEKIVHQMAKHKNQIKDHKKPSEKKRVASKLNRSAA
ncbi:MAG: ribosome-associated translation inhibitor RaiA [Bdellovibrionales bacterium]